LEFVRGGREVFDVVALGAVAAPAPGAPEQL
jgi:hypothetical protein